MRGSGAMPLRLVATVAAITGIAVACWSPTEIELDVSTDVSCTSDIHTQIFVSGSASAVASVDGCFDPQSSEIGTFVVAPSGSRSAHVEVQVALAKGRTVTPDQCVGDDSLPDCIVARRAFAFEEHHSQYVGVRLYELCFGHHCPSDQTCQPDAFGVAQCVPSAAVPSDAPAFGDDGGDAQTPPPPARCPFADQILADEPDEPKGHVLGGDHHLFWISSDGMTLRFVRKEPGFAPMSLPPFDSGGIIGFAVSPSHTKLAIVGPNKLAIVAVDPDAGPAMVQVPTDQPPFPTVCGPYTAVGVNDDGEVFLGSTVGMSNACLQYPSNGGWGGSSAGGADVLAIASHAAGTFFWADGKVIGLHAPTSAPSNVGIGALELVALQDGALYVSAQQIGAVDQTLASQWRVEQPGARDLAGTLAGAFVVVPSAAGDALVGYAPSGASHVVARGMRVHGTAIDAQCVYYWADGKIRAAAP